MGRYTPSFLKATLVTVGHNDKGYFAHFIAGPMVVEGLGDIKDPDGEKFITQVSRRIFGAAGSAGHKNPVKSIVFSEEDGVPALPAHQVTRPSRGGRALGMV